MTAFESATSPAASGAASEDVVISVRGHLKQWGFPTSSSLATVQRRERRAPPATSRVRQPACRRSIHVSYFARLPVSRTPKYNDRMKTVTLTAHVNGDNIQLDEPFALPADARLLVTILPESLPDTERQQWYALSKTGLARAYSDDEPDYPASLVGTGTA